MFSIGKEFPGKPRFTTNYKIKYISLKCNLNPWTQATDWRIPSTIGVKETASGVEETASGVKEKASGVKEKASGVKDAAIRVKEKASGVKEAANEVKK